ncbi:hypothetical protein P3T76_006852 [Phytophthora citrophthora]|uniref:Fungal-type protein kinase domain-containing protein n=1 Tax=Phytophthora citrophthora TaxID=4793 RepID=A0AAD9GP59_9STRA|nr:hypothetical protein P3T76_006852 [Phytophthora citrophthora]
MPAVDKGWADKWLKQYRKSQIGPQDLPLVGELKEFIERELPVKVAIHKRIRDNWITKMKVPSPELMEKIFRVSNSEPCVEFLNQVGYRVVYPVKPGDTHTSFISFWDALIRNVLDFVGIGKSNRPSKWSASTGSPDYLFTVDSVCVLRGEVAVPGASIKRLRHRFKVAWIYGDAPYLFGYAAVGYEVRLYAITRDATDRIELGVYDLKHLEERFRLLLAFLNIARLLRSIASLCPASFRDEYQTIIRDEGIKIFLERSRVVKCFPKELFYRAKCHAEAVYKVLEEHDIPNVDRLDHANQNSKRLIFTPRGQETKPTNLVDLFHALSNVLQALVRLHTASWIHRDIRWPNVMKNRENSWFLIDFMDAAQSPRLSKRSAPESNGARP